MSSSSRSSVPSFASFVVVFVAPLAVVFGLPHLVTVSPSTTYGQFAKHVKPADPVGCSAAFLPPERFARHRRTLELDVADRRATQLDRRKDVTAEPPSAAEPSTGRGVLQASPPARITTAQPAELPSPSLVQNTPEPPPVQRVSMHTPTKRRLEAAIVPVDLALQDQGDTPPRTSPRRYRRTGVSATPLGLLPPASELSWPDAVAELKRLGIEDFHLERGRHPGAFVFWCHYTPPDEPQSNYRFQAEAYHPLQAVAQTIAQIRAAHEKRATPTQRAPR
ncbi:MAG: hypothetical protein D6725_00945 [Planctomycetota bacterium]|nr:MAG: hypothetical protein D6725_00945 [Planctomycetota bacterium]